MKIDFPTVRIYVHAAFCIALIFGLLGLVFVRGTEEERDLAMMCFTLALASPVIPIIGTVVWEAPKFINSYLTSLASWIYKKFCE